MGNKLACQSNTKKKGFSISKSLRKYEYIAFEDDLRPIRDQNCQKLISKVDQSKGHANALIQQAGMALDMTSQLIKREKYDLKELYHRAPETLETQDPTMDDEDTFTYTKQDLQSDITEVKESKKRLKAIKKEIDDKYKGFFDFSEKYTVNLDQESINENLELDKQLKELVQKINTLKVDIEDAKEQKQKKEAKALKKELEQVYAELDRIGEQRLNLNNKLTLKGQEFDDQYWAFRNTVERLTTEVDSTLETTSLKSILRFESKAKSLDLCFLIDCTGSMGSLIANAKDKMYGILDKLNKQFGGLNIRIGVVGYRDYGDTSNRYEIHQFNDDYQAGRNFIGSLQATGGDDTAEDVNGGFQKALRDLKWQNVTRTMVHIADAPPHGTRFHNTSSVNDKYKNGAPDDAEWKDLFKEMQDKRINYIFLKLNDECNKMVEEFEIMYNLFAPEGKKKKIGGEFMHHKIDLNPENYLKVTTQTISKTVSKTMKTFGSSVKKTDGGGTTATNSKTAGYQPLIPLVDLEDSDSDDEESDARRAKKLAKLPNPNLRADPSTKMGPMDTVALPDINEDEEDEDDEDSDHLGGISEERKINESRHTMYQIEENKENQQQGAKEKKIKGAGQTLDLLQDIDPKYPLWDSTSFWDHRVKANITYMTPTSSIDQMMNGEMKLTHAVKNIVVHKTPFAEGVFSKAYYAKLIPEEDSEEPEYQVVLKKLKKPQKKSFFSAVLKKNTFVTQLADDYNKSLRDNNAPSDAKIFFVKVYIAKIYDDYYMIEPYINGNFQKYTNNFDYVNENVPLMSAFSHFSYQRTKKLFMVNDLQGCDNILTDPGVHSVTKEFSHGDFGVQGILVFFRNHVCNDFCSKLKLLPHSSQSNQIECNINRRDIVFKTSSEFEMCTTPFCNGNSYNGCNVCHASK